MLIDTHCHLDFPQFDYDREAVVKRAGDNKVRYLINVGSSLESSLRARNLANRNDNIFFSLGFHPHCADNYNENVLTKFENEANNKKLVAIGEVGLDYFKSRSPRGKQKDVFQEFIRLARKLNLPLIIHCRDSQEDTYSILKEAFADFKKIVFHCFSGPQDFLDKCLNLGAMFSFTANITYPKAVELKELVKAIPLKNIMLETDAPFLAPQKFRGQRNEPSYVHFVAQEIALLKNLSLEDIADKTTENAINFFKLNEE
jgi:TatD DNase family protein